MSFFAKVLYYGTLIGPLYRFLKDVCLNGYATYINHQEELEQAKMNARFNSDQLEELSVEDFIKLQLELRKGRKK